jgi:hypothetical protein
MNLYFKKSLSLFLPILFTLPSIGQVKAPLSAKPAALQCEHLVNPIGIDALKPRLSWLMTDPRQHAKQTAYRIVVGKDSIAVSKKKGNSWDSGKTNSAVALLNYTGAPLDAFTKYFWTVELWDREVWFWISCFTNHKSRTECEGTVIGVVEVKAILCFQAVNDLVFSKSSGKASEIIGFSAGKFQCI